jgi:hypothetical protein
VIKDLEDQAGDSTSLLNRRGASRREELLALRDNLMGTLEELDALYRKFRNMGQNAWMRVQFGQRDLTALRAKLTLHVMFLNQFTSSLTMASTGRMEPMMEEILRILRSSVRGYGAGAGSVLSARTWRGDEEWVLLESELGSEGVPRDYIRSQRGDISVFRDEMVEDEGIRGLEDVDPSDSASQNVQQPLFTIKRKAILAGKWRNNSLSNPINSRQQPLAADAFLGQASKEEIEIARIGPLDCGNDIGRISARPRFGIISSRFDTYRSRALFAALRSGSRLAVFMILQKGAPILMWNTNARV